MGLVLSTFRKGWEMESKGAAPAWRGHSDTETLLACIEAWGVEETLKRSVGMFAIALWDRERRDSVLGTDERGSADPVAADDELQVVDLDAEYQGG